MIIENFFGKEIYIFEFNEYLEHIKFLDLVLIEKPKWIKFSINNINKWKTINEYEIFIGVYNVNEHHPEFMTVCPILKIEEKPFFVEYTEGHCPACKQKYSALSTREYMLYVGLPEEAYQHAMKVPYITQCLNCDYDWDEPGLRFLAISQNGKARYAV